MTDLHRILVTIVDRVTGRLRGIDQTGSTVTLRLRFGDFARSTSSHALPRPTSSSSVVLEVARRLLDARASEIRERGCTLLGLTISGLDQHPAQLMLPFAGNADGSLDATLDAIHAKFGRSAVSRAMKSGRSARATVPTPTPAPGR